MSNENKVWLKKLVKSSEPYLKLKSKLQKERDMNKMLMEHLMSMRCVEKDVERILKKITGFNSNNYSSNYTDVYIKKEPIQETILVEDCESESELDGGFAKIHISDEPSNIQTQVTQPEEVLEIDCVLKDDCVLEEEVLEVDCVLEEEEVLEEEVLEVDCVLEEEEVLEEEVLEVDCVLEEEEVEIEEVLEVDCVLEEDEEQNVFEVEYRGKRYYTTDETNGAVYAVQDDDDIGDQIGNFVNGKLVLL